MKPSVCALAAALAASSLVLAPSPAQAADLVPSFGFVPPTWLTPLAFPMTAFWGAAGLPEQGINYYSAGAPASPSSPYWERFDPGSPLYEAWFGTYVVDDFQFASEWDHPQVRVADIPNSIQRVLALATVDQIAWLTAYQDPHPYAEVVPSTLVVLPAANGYFYGAALMKSHSDVGGTIPDFPWYPPSSAHASEVAPYADVTLTTSYLFKYLPDAHELVIVYSSGTIWKTLDGGLHATPPRVSATQLAMMLGTSFPAP